MRRESCIVTAVRGDAGGKECGFWSCNPVTVNECREGKTRVCDRGLMVKRRQGREKGFVGTEES